MIGGTRPDTECRRSANCQACKDDIKGVIRKAEAFYTEAYSGGRHERAAAMSRVRAEAARKLAVCNRALAKARAAEFRRDETAAREAEHAARRVRDQAITCLEKAERAEA